MKALTEILKGIDKDQSESVDGWWQTTDGAEFGSKKLKEIEQYANERVIEELEKLLLYKWDSEQEIYPFVVSARQLEDRIKKLTE